MKVVICGGGIIGVAVAFQLAKKGITATIIERCDTACGASGNAGALLAKNRFDSSKIGTLANISYDMHMELAKDERFKDCEYRNVDWLGVTISGDNKQGDTEAESGSPQWIRTDGMPVMTSSDLPDWVNGGVVKVKSMGTPKTVIQVHPHKLTQTLLKVTKELMGTDEVKVTVVEGIERDESNKVTGVRTQDGVIPADVVVIALGPWSMHAMKWFGLPPIGIKRTHNIILKPTAPLSSHNLFVEFDSKGKFSNFPYAFVNPRPDGTAYVCGMSDPGEMPDDPNDVIPNLESCQTLKAMSNEVSDIFQEAEVLDQKVSYVPVTSDDLPLIGAIPGTTGAYIATGHHAWGILNSLATGEALAQLITTGTCTLLDLSPFNPDRFK